MDAMSRKEEDVQYLNFFGGYKKEFTYSENGNGFIWIEKPNVNDIIRDS